MVGPYAHYATWRARTIARATGLPPDLGRLIMEYEGCEMVHSLIELAQLPKHASGLITRVCDGVMAIEASFASFEDHVIQFGIRCREWRGHGYSYIYDRGVLDGTESEAFEARALIELICPTLIPWGDPTNDPRYIALCALFDKIVCKIRALADRQFRRIMRKYPPVKK